jgi:hypothetical protein
MRSEPLTFMDVLADLRRARLSIFGGLFVAFFMALGFLALAVPHYRAQMMVGPASPLNAMQPVSERADNFFMTAENTADFMRFENMVTGPHVAGLLLKDTKIAEALFAENESGPSWSPARLSDYLRRRVHLDPVGDTRLRRMAYYHPDPVFAVYLLETIQKKTDELIRSKARTEIAQRLEYLNRSMQASREPEQRRNLATLLMEQERLLMMVSLDQPYAADIIEPASASFKPRWPQPVSVFAVFLLVGALAGFMIHGLRRAA